jgi:hypothetical protein
MLRAINEGLVLKHEALSEYAGLAPHLNLKFARWIVPSFN